MVFVNVPGTLYVCGPTGCTHQVRHTEHVPAGVEYWVAPGTGELEVSVMNRTSLRPAATASSTTYWMAGLSTTGSISFGVAFVAGRKRVPSPAAGTTALRTPPV